LARNDGTKTAMFTTKAMITNQANVGRPPSSSPPSPPRVEMIEPRTAATTMPITALRRALVMAGIVGGYDEVVPRGCV
jgi:hypothetical protein